MKTDPELFSNESSMASATGDMDDKEETKYISLVFGEFDIKIIVNQRNEFLGISEIKYNKEFLSQKQKILFILRDRAGNLKKQ